MEKVPIIAIVTPTLNSERFLNQTISSVVSQSGQHYIRFHLQDGGSTDNTIDIAHRWKHLLDNKLYPIGCLGVEMSIASQPDGSMYQAINQGFSIALQEDTTLMGWINSDDLLAPGSMATALEIIKEHPDVNWLGGRAAFLNENNSITSVDKPRVFSRRTLANGLHHGRPMPFITQEGTYWRPHLWKQAGGLDSTLKFAGDWDLWRRFAAFSQFTSVDSVLGFYRRRRGQLTESLEKYNAEVDKRLAGLQTINMSWESEPLVHFHKRWKLSYPSQKMSWLKRLNRRRLAWQRRFYWRNKEEA